MFLEGCICQYMMYISLVRLHKFYMGCHRPYKNLLSLSLIFKSSIQHCIWRINHFQYNIHSFLDKFHIYQLSSNIHICMKNSYSIFDKYKRYNFNQSKYNWNIVFRIGQVLENNQHKILFGCSSNFEYMLK